MVSCSEGCNDDSLMILFVVPKKEPEILKKEMFSESIMHEFEDREYCIPSGFDEILRACYGDYMKLPPKNKQVGSHYKYVYYLD